MKKFLVVLSTLIIGLSCMAQHKDFQTWWGAGVKGEIIKNVDIEVNPEIRLNNNSAYFRTWLTDVELAYNLTKHLKFGGVYRIQQKNNIEDVSYMVHRFGLMGRYDFKIDKFRIKYRAIYEWKYEGINHCELGNIPEQVHRHKISLSYYRKKWDLRPELSYEMYFLASPKSDADHVKSRLTAGFEYKINKKMDISIDYKLQQEYFENNPLTANILAVGINYSL